MTTTFAYSFPVYNLSRICWPLYEFGKSCYDQFRDISQYPVMLDGTKTVFSDEQSKSFLSWNQITKAKITRKA